MSYQFPPDLSRMVHDQLAAGEYSSEDEVLLDAMRALADREEAVAGIQAGIDDMEAGRVQPLAAVDARLRKRYGIPWHQRLRGF